MYQKLLLNCEGGIIDASQQAEQDNCAVVCIGLGGTGVDCLKNLKAKIYNRVRPDDPNSAVPKYEHIKFLAVDTDKSGMEKANSKSSDISRINLDTEFFDISYGGDPSELFKTNAALFETKPEYKEWLRYSEITVEAARAGAGGVRQMGRYLLMERAQDFVSKVSSLITQALAGLNGPKTYVHIFSGLSGGTGAGTFLDVCYLVQEALKRNKTNSFVCGYFFLPDVNIAAAPDRETEAYIKNNGYAALQDLDYCMNFENNGDRWSQTYSGLGTVVSENPPVDICHLISARDANGGVIRDAYKYAMNVVTDYFMDFIVKTGNDFTMESHISNYAQKKANIKKEHGAQYQYCVLGASTASLPFKEVLTYLASKMFERISNIKNTVPSKAQLEDFVTKNGLKYDAIFAQLTQRCDMTFPLPDVKWKDARGNDDLTVTYFTDMRARLENGLESNFSSLSRDLENYNPVAGVAGNVASLISKIYTALRSVATDPERGPFFAAALLRSTTGHDLISIIDGHIREARNKFAQENVQEDRLRPTWEQAQRDFFENSNAFNGGHKYDTYRNATRNLEIHYSRLTMFTKMDDLMTRLRKQLVDLANNFMDVFRNTINGLIDTFDANREYLDNRVESATSYEFPLAHIRDLKANLDLTVKEMDVNAKATDFLTMMLSEDGIKSWINNNENELFAVVNKYFTDLFSAYSHKTMTSYLQDKYNTTNSDQLIQAIRGDIMNQLDANATPLFWTSPVYNVSSASKIGYVTFPAVSTEVEEAAKQLSSSKDSGELTVRNSNIQDRISVMRCLVGVPLYGYQGLLQYENNSVRSTAVGKHLYEGKNYTNDSGEYVTGRDWRYLPSPISYSLMNDQNCGILREEGDKAKALYEEAEAKNIIAQVDLNNYGIYVISPAFMDKIRAVKAESTGKTKVEMLQGIDKIKALMTNIEYEPDKIDILNDATTTLPELNKRMVRIDHFVSAPRLQEAVRAELAKLAEVDSILEGLEPKDDTDLVNFQNALFTGVIKYARTVLTVVTDDFATESVLSKPNMAHGAVPIYQAFLSFKDLDADVKAYVAAKTSAELDALQLSDDAVTTSQTVWAELKKAPQWVAAATQLFPSEVSELKEFITAVKGALSLFAMTYGFSLE